MENSHIMYAPLLWYSLAPDPGQPLHPTALNDFGLTLGAAWGFNAYNPNAYTSAATFDGSAAPTSSSKAWFDAYGREKADELRAATAASPTALMIHDTDVIVLPTAVVALHNSSVVDPTTGRLSIDMPGTLPLIAQMIDETFARFPASDGLQVRVGENNVMDTPYHTGASAVDFSLSRSEQQRQYVKLIAFLREVVCVKHNRTLVFRTWDTAGFVKTDPPRFHGDLEYYLNVTNQVEPHAKLYFSVKHTKLDFWRWVRPNPTLNRGRHAQVVEVESEREYEGKGAYPNYIGRMVIEGFPEVRTAPGPAGFADLAAAGAFDPARGGRIRGVRVWARGGGWRAVRARLRVERR